MTATLGCDRLLIALDINLGERAIVTSSRIKLRGLGLTARHELLVDATDLDEETWQALRPEHGLSLEQADHMIENAVESWAFPWASPAIS
jgi:hypothetical protein